MARQPVAKANKLSTCERRAGSDCSPLGGGLRLGRGTLSGFGLWFFSGSFPCLTPLGFLEVLILAHRSNKEPSEYSLSWPTDEEPSQPTEIPALAARPQLRATEQGAGGGHQGASKKRPGTAIRGTEISTLTARPQLRATEQGAGGGHQGAPKKRPGTAIWGYENEGLPC